MFCRKLILIFNTSIHNVFYKSFACLLACGLIACSLPQKTKLTEEDKTELRNLIVVAREAVLRAWENGAPEQWVDYPYAAIDQGVIVRFVLEKTPQGCLAFYRGVDDLTLGARLAALNAAFHDPRYQPLQKAEVKRLEIEVCIVSKLIRMSNPMDFALGKELVYMMHPNGSVLMQPSLARDFKWNKKAFLEALCRKEGLPQDAWKDHGVVFYRAAIKELREPFLPQEDRH